MTDTIGRTDIPGYGEPYRGKVRDVYRLGADRIGLVATDRISAFDHILPRAIPYKGQVLNLLAAYQFEQISDIVETHLVEVPHPNVTIGKACMGIPVEVVVRGYLAGHAARTYAAGGRYLCGVRLPEGLRENAPFPSPILTPATKAVEGHDEDISEADLLRQGKVDPHIWEQVRTYAFRLFERGTRIAAERGLILVDTKYEFGLFHGRVVLMDEVHTPDSSRYFMADDYEERLKRGEKPRQLSKEFVREWLMGHGFQGRDGDVMPTMDDAFVEHTSQRYIELYERLTGRPFVPTPVRGYNETVKAAFDRVTGRP